MQNRSNGRLIRLLDFGGPLFYSTNDGERAYGEIAAAFNEDVNVELSFEGVEEVTVAALHEIVGSLYRDFDEGFIREHIELVNTTQDQLQKLKIVVDTAKNAFKDSARRKAAAGEALHGGSYQTS